MSYPLHPTHTPRHVKAHRFWFFQPIWQQFRYRSQAHMDLHRWGDALAKYIVSEGPDHPHYERAKAALSVREEQRESVQHAKAQLEAVLN